MSDEQDAGARADGRPGFEPHPVRALVLGELHARPFHPLQGARCFLRFGFIVDDADVEADRDWFAGYCQSVGVQGPGTSSRHHQVQIGDSVLRRERHGEFVTYTWDGALPDGADVEHAPPAHPFGARFRAPGTLLVAVRCDFVPADSGFFRDLFSRFEQSSLSASLVDQGTAIIATDFRQDRDGVTRMLVGDRSLSQVQAGALTQRLLELETYRTLAMLGLTEAHHQSAKVGVIENGLLSITKRMRASEGLDANRQLLDELTQLAADLEAGAAASAYRFGASRAYNLIVRQRLEVLDEQSHEGHFTFTQFLNRRLAPAMRTCETIEARQESLSRKLARAATLLRTRVDVELQEQNRGQLAAMNRRARLQLRLQHTVEGLSVAAVSYYVVGLVAYVTKATADTPIGALLPSPGIVTGLSVPLVIAAVFLLVRRIRMRHDDSDGDNAP